MTEKHLDPIEFFQKSLSFGSLFILTGSSMDRKIVCEIKIVNDGQGEVSFIPLGEDHLPF